MGAYYSVYVGWAFKVPRVPQLRVTALRTCLNDACVNHQKEQHSKFCPQCGQPIGVAEHRERVVAPFGYAQMHELEGGRWVDEMAIVGRNFGEEQFFVPNHRGYGVHLARDSDTKPFSIDASYIDQELEQFSARYSKFREAVETAYDIRLERVFVVVESLS